MKVLVLSQTYPGYREVGLDKVYYGSEIPSLLLLLPAPLKIAHVNIPKCIIKNMNIPLRIILKYNQTG